jgi:predicted GNAT family N-acyltransferase
MSIHQPERTFSNGARFIAGHGQGVKERARHAVLDLEIGELGKRFVVFTPSGPAVAAIVAHAARNIGEVATLDCVRRVASHNPDSLWAIARKSRYDACNPVAEGFFAFLMLNTEGLRQLAAGTLDGANPDLALLAAQNERPAGIYSWAVYAPRGLAAALPLVMQKISSPLYQGIDVFARPTTEDGARFVESVGLRNGAVIDGQIASHLHWLQRSASPEATPPIYDSYRVSNEPSQIGIALARTLEDLLRVFSIRSAVYCADQGCSYEEEFDGNDFCASHLLGYIGHEPAGCVRIRYFADFAQLERITVRREFRGSLLAQRLIRAAIELCGVKGYRRLYSQPSTDLLRFYSHFGFRHFDGGKFFQISGIDFAEMVLDLERNPDAMAVGMDPYAMIRPEGRWHSPGILERSEKRPVGRKKRTREAALELSV